MPPYRPGPWAPPLPATPRASAAPPLAPAQETRPEGDVVVTPIAHSSIQLEYAGTVVHVDHGVPCTIGERVAIGHRAIVHGATVGEECLIAMGAILLNHVVVGAGSVIGAGAVVTKDVPDFAIAAGVPESGIGITRSAVATGASTNMSKHAVQPRRIISIADSWADSRLSSTLRLAFTAPASVSRTSSGTRSRRSTSSRTRHRAPW